MKISNKITKSNIDLSLSYIIFRNISVKKKHSTILDQYIANTKKKVKSIYTLNALKNDDTIRKFRDFYWHYLNIDPTKIRPSAEALIRRILANRKIPQISNIVDLNNWVSIDTLIPLGTYDLGFLKFPLVLRFAKEREEFIPIGGTKKVMRGNEIILVDNTGLIIHQYPHRDSDVSKITMNTKNILLIACGVPGILTKNLERSLIIFRDLLEKISKYQINSSIIKTI